MKTQLLSLLLVFSINLMVAQQVQNKSTSNPKLHSQEINKAILAIKIGQKYNRDILIKYLIKSKLDKLMTYYQKIIV